MSAVPAASGDNDSEDEAFARPASATSPGAAHEEQRRELDRLRQGLQASLAAQASYEAQLSEARATIQHFASQLTAPPAVTQVQPAMNSAFYSPAITAPLPLLPGLSMPIPTVPVSQLIPTGSGRAAVYGPTVQARQDAAVFHALGYDTGDIIRQSAEVAAIQRELERQVALRPMVPVPHPVEPGLPARHGGPDNNVYEEDDFEMTPTPSTPTRRAPFPATDKATPVAHGARDYGGKGGGNKVKMLPPYLHLKGWDVSTEKFRDWYRSVELFMTAHQIPRDQWAAPIVAACQDKAHRALRHLDVLRLNEPGAIEVVTHVLTNTFMRPQEDRIASTRRSTTITDAPTACL